MLVFLSNLGMGGGGVVAGRPGRYRRRYTLPDGRRILATDGEIRRILAEYTRQEEIPLPPEVEEIFEERTEYVEPAPESEYSALMSLAETVGPQMAMEVTDDLTRDEAIALGRMIQDREDEEAILALLLAH